MKSLIAKITKVFTLLGFWFLACFLVYSSYHYWSSLHFWEQLIRTSWFLFLLSGLLFRIGCSLISKRLRKTDPINFLDTLEHELTHGLWGYLFWSPPQSLVATSKRGGKIQLEKANFFIVLAPYFFPLWGIGLSFIGQIVHPRYSEIWSCFTWFILGGFIYRVVTETKYYQTDLQTYGFLFSLSFLIHCWWTLTAFMLWLHRILSTEQIQNGFFHLSNSFLEFLQNFYNSGSTLVG